MLSKVLRGTENSPYRYLLFYEAFDLGILETREMPPLPEKLAMPGKLPVKPSAKIAETQTRHRAAFLKLILDNPKACRGEIAALNKAATKWLRKYDKAWWVAQSARIRIGKRTNYKTCQEADLEALAFAEKAIAIDMSRDARPGVITVSHLAMLLPPRERHFLLVWGNQPRTQAFIAKYQDADVLEVYRKRIRWALLRVEGGKMGYRAFCELAGLKAAIRKYPEVDKMARDAIREIQ